MNKLIVGQMRLSNLSDQDAFSFLSHVYEKGFNHFDHADLYGNGECERKFGRWLKEQSISRSSLFIQSKCGICENNGIKYYDNSKDYILSSVDQSLARLNCEYLDLFLIHRPDVLMDANEIAEAFNQLKDQGKVRSFGVSNFNSAQIQYLSSTLSVPIAYNQLQLSLAFAPMISEGTESNTYNNNGIVRSLGILDYCRAHNITMQAWSPLQFGTFAGTFIDHPNYANLNAVLWELAQKYQVSKTAIALAWIFRINPNMQVISGTCNKQHFDELAQALNVKLSREEWYKLYQAAGYMLP